MLACTRPFTALLLLCHLTIAGGMPGGSGWGLRPSCQHGHSGQQRWSGQDSRLPVFLGAAATDCGVSRHPGFCNAVFQSGESPVGGWKLPIQQQGTWHGSRSSAAVVYMQQQENIATSVELSHLVGQPTAQLHWQRAAVHSRIVTNSPPPSCSPRTSPTGSSESLCTFWSLTPCHTLLPSRPSLPPVSLHSPQTSPAVSASCNIHLNQSI
jgi:hypothetical protein